MRIWFDMTAPAHPVVFRPVIARLQAAGHDIHVTARDYAQTLPLLQRMRISHTVIGRHGGASRVRKVAALASRTTRMIAHGRGRGFDLAVAHGSNDLALAAAALRIPEVNAFDYEWATKQHQIGCRRGAPGPPPHAPPDRLPAGPPRPHARRDPAGAPAPLRGRAGEAPSVPRAQGGVLPERL